MHTLWIVGAKDCIQTGKKRGNIKTWRNVFRISDEENLEFDQTHERNVNNYLNSQECQLQQFERTNLDRVDPDNYLTRPVTNTDINP